MLDSSAISSALIRDISIGKGKRKKCPFKGHGAQTPGRVMSMNGGARNKRENGSDSACTAGEKKRNKEGRARACKKTKQHITARDAFVFRLVEECDTSHLYLMASKRIAAISQACALAPLALSSEGALRPRVIILFHCHQLSGERASPSWAGQPAIVTSRCQVTTTPLERSARTRAPPVCQPWPAWDSHTPGGSACMGTAHSHSLCWMYYTATRTPNSLRLDVPDGARITIDCDAPPLLSPPGGPGTARARQPAPPPASLAWFVPPHYATLHSLNKNTHYTATTLEGASHAQGNKGKGFLSCSSLWRDCQVTRIIRLQSREYDVGVCVRGRGGSERSTPTRAHYCFTAAGVRAAGARETGHARWLLLLLCYCCLYR